MKELVIVTGASSGIGAATAALLEENGFHSVGTVRSSGASNALANRLVLDVADEKSIETAVSSIRSLLDSAPKVHLVNNAGIAVAGPVEAVPLARWREQFEVNVFGLVRMSQALLPWIRKTGGRIVNVSSVNGIVTSPYLGPYSASKFSVEAISDALRRELAGFGVEVIAVQPGPVATPIWEKNFSRLEEEMRSFGPEMNQVYGGTMQGFAALARKSAEEAVPVEYVSETILRALKAPRPRTRYVVGSMAGRMQMALLRFLPDRWIDALVAKQFR